MKTIITILLLSVALFSCKKENTRIQDNLLLNSKLDEQLSARNIVYMSKGKIDSLVIRKINVLSELYSQGVNIQEIHSDPGGDPDYAQRTDCSGQYNYSIKVCDAAFYANVAASAMLAAGAGMVGTPALGAGVLAAGVAKDTYNHWVCAMSALRAKIDCLAKQK